MATQEELLRQQQQDLYTQASQPAATATTEWRPATYTGQPATTATTATYIDDSGNKQIGLVQPNTDVSDYYDRMRDYQGQIYADTLAANAQALEDAQKRAREAADAQRETLTQGYQGTNRQLYRDYMEHRRTLPQEMAAAGYSGGLSESSNIRLRNSYEEALAQNERARLSEEAGIENNYAQQAYEAEAARRAADQQARQNQYSYLMALEEARYQQQQQELANRANTMAQTGDYSAYAQLGYSQDEIDALTRMWLQQNPTLKDTWIKNHPEDAARLGLSGAKRGGGSGGYYGGGAVPNEKKTENLVDEAMGNIAAGATPQQVQAGLSRSVAAGEMTQAEAAAVAAEVNRQYYENQNRLIQQQQNRTGSTSGTTPGTSGTAPSGWTGNEPAGGGAIATGLMNLYGNMTPEEAYRYDLYQQALARGGY